MAFIAAWHHLLPAGAWIQKKKKNLGYSPFCLSGSGRGHLSSDAPGSHQDSQCYSYCISRVLRCGDIGGSSQKSARSHLLRSEPRPGDARIGCPVAAGQSSAQHGQVRRCSAVLCGEEEEEDTCLRAIKLILVL